MTSYVDVMFDVRIANHAEVEVKILVLSLELRNRHYENLRFHTCHQGSFQSSTSLVTVHVVVARPTDLWNRFRVRLWTRLKQCVRLAFHRGPNEPSPDDNISENHLIILCHLSPPGEESPLVHNVFPRCPNERDSVPRFPRWLQHANAPVHAVEEPAVMSGTRSSRKLRLFDLSSRCEIDFIHWFHPLFKIARNSMFRFFGDDHCSHFVIPDEHGGSQVSDARLRARTKNQGSRRFFHQHPDERVTPNKLVSSIRSPKCTRVAFVRGARSITRIDTRPALAISLFSVHVQRGWCLHSARIRK